MSRQIGVTARKLEQFARQRGWRLLSEAKGSHRVFTHPTLPGVVYISYHGSKDIPVGTLESAMKIIQGEKP